MSLGVYPIGIPVMYLSILTFYRDDINPTVPVDGVPPGHYLCVLATSPSRVALLALCRLPHAHCQCGTSATQRAGSKRQLCAAVSRTLGSSL